MIVIIGTDNQYQVELIRDKLIERNYDVVLVDFLKNNSVSIREVDGRIGVECEGVALDHAKVVYHDPKYLVPQFGDTEEWAEAKINSTGWKHFNHNLFEVLNGVKLNSLKDIWIASQKIYQLQVAMGNGFNTPPFVLSNSKKDLLSFLHQQKLVIAKDIGDGVVPVIRETVSQKVIMTSPVDEAMIESTDEKQPFPVLLQKNIQKRYEYRIIVVGESMIAFRIDSNQHPIMNQDYRRGGFMVTYEKVDLDLEFKQRLLSLHYKFNLFSGSYDFIEDTNNKFYFLEVNPAGVWAYIDQTCNGEISDLFVKEISKVYDKIN